MKLLEGMHIESESDNEEESVVSLDIESSLNRADSEDSNE